MTLVLFSSMAMMIAGGLMLSGAGLLLIAAGHHPSSGRGPARVL